MFAIIIALLSLILVSLWVGFYQLVKQQGRILLRLDALERHDPAPPAEPLGIPVGEQFPAFSFPDLDGNTVALEQFRGKSVLLVYWNPGCGFCDMIAPDLARAQADLEKRHVQLLLLAHGEVEANRKLADEHGLRCPILIHGDRPVPAPMASLGTPSAFLLDVEGCAAKPLAIGADKVPALVVEAAAGDFPSKRRLPGSKSLSASNIVRDGLKSGTPAPEFKLPDLHGGTVSLSDYRGRRLLLVFSDPHCGPCDLVAPQLAQLEKGHRGNGLSFVMVGRGGVEENRQKAQKHNIGFPVVLQDKWKVSKAYGIFATPVAFLIDEAGVIARDVAMGPDPIIALAQEGLRAEEEKKHELSHR